MLTLTMAVFVAKTCPRILAMMRRAYITSGIEQVLVQCHYVTVFPISVCMVVKFQPLSILENGQKVWTLLHRIRFMQE